jgi:hypothetical protein
MIWGSPKAMGWQTMIGLAREVQGHCRRCCLLPVREERDGWRSVGRQCALRELRRIDSLRDKQGGKVRKVRRVMGKEVGEREGARAHRRRRIQAEMHAGLRMIGDTSQTYL